MRRWLGVLGVLVLLVVTGAVVVLALRPAEPPPTPDAPAGAGSLAVVGDRMWRWLGPSECTPAADDAPLERWVRGMWQPADVPLVNVTAISFTNARDGIAVGTTSNCALGLVVTRDGGATWASPPQSPPMLDAVLVGRTVWAVVRGTESGQTLVTGYTLDGEPVDSTPPIDTSPCDETDGTPTHVAAFTADFVLQLCQQGPSNGRLLARTVDGGVIWDRLTDNRVLTGLDGDGTFTRLEVAGVSSVWVLFVGGECSEGQLRRSANTGQSFERLPCPSKGANVAEVFDVAFSSATDGTLLGLDSAGEPVVLTSTDAGTTWE